MHVRGPGAGEKHPEVNFAFLRIEITIFEVASSELVFHLQKEAPREGR